MFNFTMENIYGHEKRVNWIISNLTKNDIVVELGCGTGVMITMPLALRGYNIKGVDFDEESISFGKSIFKKYALKPELINTQDIRHMNENADVIIASEVLEHIADQDINNVLTLVNNKLKAGGKFIVTVPNGYGWFELESFLWFKTGIGWFFEKFKIVSVIQRMKKLILKRKIIDYPYPSTLSDSNHLQKFTITSISNLLVTNGFDIIESKGSVLFAGPFSNLFFTGIKPIMKINCLLGDLFPKMAAGFYLLTRKNNENNSNAK